MSLFPIIQPTTAETAGVSGLYVETKWDFENNAPVYKNGSPVLVEGAEAVLTWAWNAVNTPRFRHEIFTWSYGNESENLIGQPFTDELKQAEAKRFVSECLLINPYITDVTDIAVDFSDDRLAVSCTIKTVYGEVKLNV